MNSHPTNETRNDPADLARLPATVPDGSTILVASPAGHADRALPLRISDRYAEPGDSRLVVTTRDDADRAIDDHRELATGSGADRLGVVDASADGRSSAPFQEHPTVSVANPSELSRILLALWELEDTLSKGGETVHVVVRSLSPMLESEGVDRVSRVVDQLARRRRSTGGVAVLGIEYTNHENRTMAELRELVDVVVWVEASADGSVRLDAERSRVR